jgi:small subunit ribosomal protein S14
MAKTSSVEKNNRRRKLVDSYAAKRKAGPGEVELVRRA